MLFSILLNTNKQAAFNNEEVFGCFIKLSENNYWMVKHRVGEYVNLAEQYTSFAMDTPEELLVGLMKRYTPVPGLDTDSIVIGPDVFTTEYRPLIPLNTLQRKPAFSLLSDFLDCDLQKLMNDIIHYFETTEIHTPQSFIEIFRPFDLHIIYENLFLDELKGIINGESDTVGLSKMNHADLTSAVMGCFKPYFALQAFGLAYFSDPEVHGNLLKFDHFCNLFHSFQYKDDTIADSFAEKAVGKSAQNKPNQLLLDFIRNPKSIDAAKELLETIPSASPDFDNNDHFFCCQSYSDLLYSQFRLIIMNGLLLKRCANCGKYFVAIKRTDMEYCNRPSPQDPERTCRVIGPNRVYHDRVAKSETLKNERRLYNLLLNRCKRHPENLENKINFDHFVAENKKKKAAIKKDESLEQHYDAWLMEMLHKYRK